MAKRVLVVDDSKVIRRLCSQILQQAGYEVLEAWDAFQARAVLQSNDVAFMICDLNIPGTSGLELVEELRAEPKFVDLPVAILSAERTVALTERAKRAGVKSWIPKPCKPELLVEIVTKIVGGPR